MLSIGTSKRLGRCLTHEAARWDQLTAGRKQVLEGDGWGSAPVRGSDSSGVTQG